MNAFGGKLADYAELPCQSRNKMQYDPVSTMRKSPSSPQCTAGRAIIITLIAATAGAVVGAESQPRDYTSKVAAVRVYSSREDSVGVSLPSQGTQTRVRSLDVWQMKNVYDDTR